MSAASIQNEHRRAITPAGASLWFRAGRALLVAAALCLVALSFSSSPASAAKKKKLPPGYAPNGCTLSPDRGVTPTAPPTYYDFKDKCNRHDYCYDELWYGGGENGRAKCDSNFRREMRGWCANQYRGRVLYFQRNECYKMAQIYYGAVRAFGKDYFDNPNKN